MSTKLIRPKESACSPQSRSASPPSPSGSAPTRKKTLQACARCKAKKRKCDGVRPHCHACALEHIELCTYEKTSQERFDDMRDEVVYLRERVSKLEQQQQNQQEQHIQQEQQQRQQEQQQFQQEQQQQALLRQAQQYQTLFPQPTAADFDLNFSTQPNGLCRSAYGTEDPVLNFPEEFLAFRPSLPSDTCPDLNGSVPFKYLHYDPR